jgi:hypothetical protein
MQKKDISRNPPLTAVGGVGEANEAKAAKRPFWQYAYVEKDPSVITIFDT